MPLLFIDITLPQKLGFIMSEQGVKKKYYRKKYPNLLVCLDDFLKRNHLALPKISGLVLLEGGGTFSGVRLAAAILNAIYLVGGIPVLGLDKRKYGDNWDKIFQAAQRQLRKKSKKDFIPTPSRVGPISRGKVWGFIKPVYTGEPNITYSL